MPSIHDVAEKAGVSVATVSRVMNNSATVLPETKQQVQAAIHALGYKPLRVQKQKKNPNIMVLVPDISNTFYSDILKGIGDYCIETDWNMLLCNTNYSHRREWEFMDMLKNKVAQGAIFLGPELKAEEMLSLSMQYPVVQCCEFIENIQVSHISIDNKTAAYEAMRHLLGLGHKKIGLLTSDNHFLSTREREGAYYRALKENSIEVNPNYVISSHTYEYKSGLRAMMNLLQLSDPPTAVFAISDLMAIGAVSAALSSGMRVPDDMAVMGFDDIEFASMYTPSLTTVAQPRYDLGYNAMDMLAKKIRGQSSHSDALFLEHELKIRASTVKI
ncbi:HTH-type transcriptional repressor CytR [Blautia producta]|uniref:HTH-type transcriptional repressor CytR n=1 Tax=Blautia producta TaxID=33035 RepID=A0A4P6LVV6_9FIRM|nr:LacI family DNA-binding transcriptional regulator [Blautia producta]QBE96641.1 HTH-type transcriptional repressor CytR [Blautia producta]